MSANVIDNTTGEIIALAPLAPFFRKEQTSLALFLPEDMAFEDWAHVGGMLAAMEKGIQWWIGDWWVYGGAKYGERAKVAAEGIFGRSFGGLMNLGAVARKFETSRRREVLPFFHHAAVAALPPAAADEMLDRAAAEGWTQREIKAAVSRHRTAAQLNAPSDDKACRVSGLFRLAQSSKKFGCIYMDPPWKYDNQGTRAATGGIYRAEVDEDGNEVQPSSGMTIAEIMALPIGELGAKDAHLHLWTTNAFLRDCFDLFDAWGFEFRTSFVWVKPQMGIGNYWRNSHEIMLTAIRGDARRFNQHDQRSWLECDRAKHSEKPFIVRDTLVKVSPGPYLELFARTQRDPWVAWGNDIERTMFDHAIAEVAA